MRHNQCSCCTEASASASSAPALHDDVACDSSFGIFWAPACLKKEWQLHLPAAAFAVCSGQNICMQFFGACCTLWQHLCSPAWQGNPLRLLALARNPRESCSCEFHSLFGVPCLLLLHYS